MRMYVCVCVCVWVKEKERGYRVQNNQDLIIQNKQYKTSKSVSVWLRGTWRAMAEMEEEQDGIVPPKKSHNDYDMPKLMRVAPQIKATGIENFRNASHIEETTKSDNDVHDGRTGQKHGDFGGEGRRENSPVHLKRVVY